MTPIQMNSNVRSQGKPFKEAKLSLLFSEATEIFIVWNTSQKQNSPSIQLEHGSGEKGICLFRSAKRFYSRRERAGFNSTLVNKWK